MKIQIYRVANEWWHQAGVPNPHWTVVLYRGVLDGIVILAQDCMSASWEEAKQTAEKLWNDMTQTDDKYL